MISPLALQTKMLYTVLYTNEKDSVKVRETTIYVGGDGKVTVNGSKMNIVPISWAFISAMPTAFSTVMKDQKLRYLYSKPKEAKNYYCFSGGRYFFVYLYRKFCLWITGTIIPEFKEWVAKLVDESSLKHL